MITFDHIQFDTRRNAMNSESTCQSKHQSQYTVRNEVITQAPFEYTHIQKMTSPQMLVLPPIHQHLVSYDRNKTPFRDTRSITSYRIILYLWSTAKQSSSLFSFSSIHSYVIVILRCASRNQLNIVVMFVPQPRERKISSNIPRFKSTTNTEFLRSPREV